MPISIDFNRDLKSDVLAHVHLPGNTQQEITCRSLKKHWDYGTKKDIECLRCHLQDGMIVLEATIASDQGGVIAVWDTNKADWVHVQEGSYVVATLLIDTKALIALHYVHNYSTVPYNRISICKFGTMDAWDKTGSIGYKKLEINQWENYSEEYIQMCRDEDIIRILTSKDSSPLMISYSELKKLIAK